MRWAHSTIHSTRETRKLVWTRSAEDWNKDQVFFSSSLGPPIRLPCIHREILTPLEGDLDWIKQHSFFQMIVASPFCAQILVTNPHLKESLNKVSLAYCVGSETKKNLSVCLDSEQILTPDRGIRTLKQWIPHLIGRLRASSDPVLLPGADIRTIDSEKILKAFGLKVRKLDLYRTRRVVLNDGEILQRLDEPSIGSESPPTHLITCFSSPSAIAGFRQGYEDRLRTIIGTYKVTAVCLGPTTSEIAQRYFKHVFTAPQNRLSSLVEKAEELVLIGQGL